MAIEVLRFGPRLGTRRIAQIGDEPFARLCDPGELRKRPVERRSRAPESELLADDEHRIERAVYR